MKNNWRPRFFTIWVGQAASILTSSVLQMALIWHLTAITKSAMILSIASIAAFLPLAILGGITGTLVDRWNRKLVMISADVFIAGVSLTLVLYSLFAPVPVWLVLAIIFVRSIGIAFHTPAISAITPLIVPEEHLTRCAGITQTLETMGYIIGAAVAGMLYPLWGITGMIAMDVVGAVIASITVGIVHIPAVEKTESQEAVPTGMLYEMKEGFKALKGNKGLFSLLWVGASFTMFFAPINALFPLLCMGYFGGTTTHAAIAEISFAVGMLLGGVLLGTWGGFKNRAVSIIGGILLLGVGIGVVGILPTSAFIIFVALCGIMGLSSPFYNGPVMALMQEKIKAEYMGRVFGLMNSVMSMSMPIGLIASGLFADKVGVHTWFFITGICCVIIGIVAMCLPSIRNVEKSEKQK